MSGVFCFGEPCSLAPHLVAEVRANDEPSAGPEFVSGPQPLAALPTGPLEAAPCSSQAATRPDLRRFSTSRTSEPPGTGESGSLNPAGPQAVGSRARSSRPPDSDGSSRPRGRSHPREVWPARLVALLDRSPSELGLGSRPSVPGWSDLASTRRDQTALARVGRTAFQDTKQPSNRGRATSRPSPAPPACLH